MIWHNIKVVRDIVLLLMWTWDAVWKVLQPQPKHSGMFAHLHQVGFRPTLTNLGKYLWWWWCECEAIGPSTTSAGAQTPHICMTWTWDVVWKVLQPQSKRSGMVCTLASGRISAYSHKSGEVSVMVTLWVWSHMPIHNLRRCSNTSYMYHVDMGCNLKGSTASTKV